MKPELNLENYIYSLPQKFIAQKPLEQRGHSKMLVLDKRNGKISHDLFYNIPAYLNKGDLLVLNESKVLKCRLAGKKETTGAKIECFVLDQTKNIRSGEYNCQVLLKPSKRLKPGDKVLLGNSSFKVIEKMKYGKAIVNFSDNPEEIMEKYGKVPLPPYIKNNTIDEDRYQTVYAKIHGSTAAPTAGFHFTEKIMEELSKKGIGFAKVCLSIGLDTFKPIVEKNIKDHIIHMEKYSISKKEAEIIMDAQQSGGRIIAVGTTTTRVLETAAEENGTIRYGSGNTGLYIYPGYKFKIVNALITNFHLPCSTLLVMVSAFAGRNNILNAYEAAKQNNYRFFSFGDCMLIN